MYVIDKAPRDIVIKDKNDLIRKLEEGMEDTDSGKVCSIEEAFEEVTEILNNWKWRFRIGKVQNRNVYKGQKWLKRYY